MAEYEQDPSANTGRFRAFVEQAQAEDRATGTSPAKSRGLLIGGAVLAVVIIVVILAVAL